MAVADSISKMGAFPRVGDLDNKTLDEIRAMGLLPPFHPKCRCDLVMLWKKIRTETFTTPPSEIPKIETSAEKGLSRLKPNDFKHLEERYLGFRYKRADSTGQDLIGKKLSNIKKYDAKPTVVSKKVFESELKNSKEEFPELWRGLGDPKFAEQFKTGDFYCGTGIYGDGGAYVGYGAGAKGMGELYCTGGKDALLRMQLKKGARVVDYDDLQKLMVEDTGSKQFLENLWERVDSNESLAYLDLLRNMTKDPGHYAMLRGYDAIRVASDKQMVILNRGAVLVQGD